MYSEPSLRSVTVWSNVDLAASGDSAIENHTKLIATGTPMKSTISASRRNRKSPDIAETATSAAITAMHAAETIAAVRSANA